MIPTQYNKPNLAVPQEIQNTPRYKKYNQNRENPTEFYVQKPMPKTLIIIHP